MQVLDFLSWTLLTIHGFCLLALTNTFFVEVSFMKVADHPIELPSSPCNRVRESCFHGGCRALTKVPSSFGEGFDGRTSMEESHSWTKSPCAVVLNQDATCTKSTNRGFQGSYHNCHGSTLEAGDGIRHVASIRLPWKLDGFQGLPWKLVTYLYGN